MIARNLGNDYVSTIHEEIANTISHGVMMVIALFAVPFAAIWSYAQYNTLTAVSVSIYAIALFLMFTVSTLYHSMTANTKHKEVFHLLDHIFIFVTIAACYTPPALNLIGGWQGIAIVCIQWSIVLFGILYKSLVKNQNQKVSLITYIAMGWMIVIFGPKIYQNASTTFLIWLIAGGLLYTIGAIIYGKKGFKYHHLVWHLFINLAAICHFISFVFYLHD
ncbi:MAG: hemolysin III family protein [Paludibacteraceae bacterium]|nr:hemolysin III family protein [Paludibacteraceae bacterium]